MTTRLILVDFGDHPAPPVHVTSRESLIRWHCWNDRNGVYTDEDSEAEGWPPLTLEQARDLYEEQMAEVQLYP